MLLARSGFQGRECVHCADVSTAFEDLVARLLDKNPATRIGWEELPQHPFWADPLPTVAMPGQPLLELYMRDNCLASSFRPAEGHQVALTCVQFAQSSAHITMYV